MPQQRTRLTVTSRPCYLFLGVWIKDLNPAECLEKVERLWHSVSFLPVFQVWASKGGLFWRFLVILVHQVFIRGTSIEIFWELRYTWKCSGVRRKQAAVIRTTAVTFPSVQHSFFVFVFDYFQLLVEPLSPSRICPQHCYLSLLLIICLLTLMNSITSFQRKLLPGCLRQPEVSTNCEY